MYPDDFPEPLKDLLEALKAAIAALFIILLYEGITYLETWQAEMHALLARYHIASYMLGIGTPELSVYDWEQIENYYQTQTQFLDAFALEIFTAGIILAAWQARALMYAGAITAPYWKGNTKGLNLPNYPGDGSSECKSHDRCMWEIKTLNETNGDYDAFWVLEGATPDGRNCQTCLDRARTWNPLQIRNGVTLLSIGA
jgi:hypothetical protein